MPDELNPLSKLDSLEPPKLKGLPSGPEAVAPLSTASNVKRALAVFLAGISRPDLAAALSQQFQAQDEQAKAEAEQRFRNDLAMAQAINAQRITEFGLQQEAAKAPGEAKLQALQIKKGEQDVAQSEREARAAGVYTPEQEAANKRRADELALENAKTELALHKATLASVDQSIQNAQSEEQADELKRVRDHLDFLIKQKQDAFEIAAKASAPKSAQELAAAGLTADQIEAELKKPSTDIAALYKESLTVRAPEQAEILADLKAVAPHIPEERLSALLTQAFNIPRPSNNVTVDSWMKSVTELHNIVGPMFTPFAATAVSKAFTAAGLSSDEADIAAADVLTNEAAPSDITFGPARDVSAPVDTTMFTTQHPTFRNLGRRVALTGSGFATPNIKRTENIEQVERWKRKLAQLEASGRGNSLTANGLRRRLKQAGAAQ